MSMVEITEEKVKSIYNYFKKLDGVRYSDYVVEMRRQISNQLKNQGVTHQRISKILGVSITMPIFYGRMIPRDNCKEVIDKFLWKWINEGLYPRSIYKEQNIPVKLRWMEYELSGSDDLLQGYKKYRSRVPNVKRGSNLDSIIDNL